MKEKIMRFVLVIGLATLLTAGLLAIETYTRPIIEEKEELNLKKSVLEALGIPYNKENINQVFSNMVQGKQIQKFTYYRSDNGAVAFVVAGSGLWAPIKAVLALESDLTTIQGLSIIQQAETPGLGGRIEEEEFLTRFSGKSINPNIRIVKPGEADMKYEVDGITGATMTGQALQKIINQDYRRYISLIKKEL